MSNFETEFLSHGEKFSLLLLLLTVSIVFTIIFKKYFDKILITVGLISPLFGFMFLYLMWEEANLPVENNLPLPDLNRDAPSPPIILVIMDELSLPVLLDDKNGIDRSKFPNFYKLAKDSVWFRQAISNFPSSSHSFPSFLTGKYSLTEENMAFSNNVENLPNLSLPYRLKRVGYRIKFATDHFGCKGIKFECAQYHSGGNSNFLSRVFSKFIQEFGPDYLIDRYIPFLYGSILKEQNERFIQLPNNIEPNTLYIVHLLSSHAPYVFNKDGNYLYSENLRMATGANFKASLENYKSQLIYLDDVLGKFLEQLNKSAAIDKTILAVIADHGNCWTQECPGRVYPSRIKRIVPELPRIPAFIRVPGVNPRIDDGDFQLVDLLPTILDAAKLPIKNLENLDGRSSLHKTGAPRKRKFYLGRATTGLDLGLPVRSIVVPNK